MSSIKDYYTGLKVSENIRHIEVNEIKYKMYKYRNDDYINSIYQKYNIKRYEDKVDFMKSKETYEMTENQKEALWIEYEHRDKLIRTGQYDDYRIELFRDNYLKGLRRLGASEKEIELLRSLSIEQWNELQELPQAEKDNIKDKQLPPLGLFNYNDKNYLYSVRNDIGLLLEERFGIKYEYEDDSLIKQSNKYLKTLVPKSELKFINDENELTTYNDMLIHTDRKKLIESKPDSFGNTHYYIKGIGSEKGKNSQLIKDILKAKGIKY